MPAAHRLPPTIGLMPLDSRIEAIFHISAEAERLGYLGISLPDTWSYASPVLLGAIAAHTTDLQLNTGILSIWGRSPAAIAMTALTLQHLSGGRFVLGLGTSTAQLAEGLHDVPFRAPAARLRRTLRQVRALINGDRLPLESNSHAHPLRLNFPAAPELPIYLAATGPSTIQLCGELCDGWIPFLFPRSRLQEGLALLQVGAARSGQAEKSIQIGPVIPAIVAADMDTARQGAAWLLTIYLTRMGPVYLQALSRLGYRREVQAVLEANTGRKPGVVPPAAEALFDDVLIYGTPQTVRPQLESWYRAGATSPALMLNPHLDLEQITGVLEALRPAQAGTG